MVLFFALQKRMGWIEGAGLGAQNQGRVLPVVAKVPKSRQGLGAATAAAEAAASGLHFRVLCDDEMPNGPHTWTEDRERLCPPSADGDLVYWWSRWRDIEDAKALPGLALEALQNTALLPPTSEDARGLPITAMETQIQYCSEELLFEMLFYKVSHDRIVSMTL